MLFLYSKQDNHAVSALLNSFRKCYPGNGRWGWFQKFSDIIW